MSLMFIYIVIISAFLLAYTFVIYPIITFIIALFGKELVLDDNITECPHITIALSVYNEERFVENAIRSVYSTDYPSEKIRLVIGSDGSNDKTNDIIESLLIEIPGVVFHKLGRSGKNLVLNTILADNKDDYIFYMDADCRLEKQTISKLVQTLQHEDVGAVIASMQSINADLESEESGEKGEGLYQKYENAMKINESKIFSTVASCGLFYGIKAKYYIPLPNANVCDDLLPLLDIAKHHKRILYMKDAIANEYREKTISNEFKRRIRIMAGAYATVASGWKILLPSYGWYSFAFWSHKLLRYVAPFFMLFILISTGFLYNNTCFYPLLLGQSIFYGIALIGKFLDSSNTNIPLLKIFYYFVQQNIASFLGFFKFLTSKNISQWNNH